MTAELLDIKAGDAVFTEVKDDVELEDIVNSGDVDDVTLVDNDLSTVAVTEIAALVVLEGTLDNEITDEPVGNCSAVVILEIEAHDETVLVTELLRDFSELKETAGVFDSIDADEDDVMLRVAIDERDNNGEDVDDNEATNEMLPWADNDGNAVSVP